MSVDADAFLDFTVKTRVDCVESLQTEGSKILHNATMFLTDITQRLQFRNKQELTSMPKKMVLFCSGANTDFKLLMKCCKAQNTMSKKKRRKEKTWVVTAMKTVG